MSGDPVFNKSELDHVVRAVPPWRTETLTECGRLIADVAGQVLTRDELVARFKQFGQHRTALTMCMVCFDRARYVPVWAQSPRAVMHRETERPNRNVSDLIERELRAIAALIAAHREEFDGYVSGLEHTASLAAARAKKRRAH